MYIFSQYSHITCTLSQVQLKTDSDILTAENTEDVMSSQLHVQLMFPRVYTQTFQLQKIYTAFWCNSLLTLCFIISLFQWNCICLVYFCQTEYFSLPVPASVPLNLDPLTHAIWLNYCIPCSYNPHSLKKKKTTDIITWNKLNPQHCERANFFVEVFYALYIFHSVIQHASVTLWSLTCCMERSSAVDIIVSDYLGSLK